MNFARIFSQTSSKRPSLIQIGLLKERKSPSSREKRLLGYTKDNYQTLKEQIHSAVAEGTAKLVSMSTNDHGTVKFKFIISVKGPNGRSENVVAVYGIGKSRNKPRMITNYIERK